MERCPHCRGRLRSPTCARCGADLSLVFNIETQAKTLAQNAVHHLLDGKDEKAEQLAIQAKALHAAPFHQALEGFIKSRKDVADMDGPGL